TPRAAVASTAASTSLLEQSSSSTVHGALRPLLARPNDEEVSMMESQQLPGGRADVLVRGGRVVDPASSYDGIADVAIAEGRIAAVGNLGEVATDRVIDATGRLVTPGLIDLHVHAFGALGFADVDTVGVKAG